MAVGKNKRISKGRKGGKKKVIDPFLRKDWYDIKAPAPFTNRNVGKTLVTRSSGTKVASDSLKGRVVPVSLADLNTDEDQAFRIMKLRIEDVQGKNCLTNFHGMDFTSDKLKFFIKKWQSLIEAHVDVKTIDGYSLRIFAIAFTKKISPIPGATCYAKSSQKKQIRKKMMDIINRATTVDLKDLVVKFIPDSIGKLIERESQGIYPLSNCFIRKVKILKTPKFDAYKLLEIHGDHALEEPGQKVERAEAPVEAQA